MAAYKRVLFDVDDTILDFQDTEEQALKKTMASFHVPCTERMLDTYKKINHGLWRKLEQGIISREEIFSTRFALFLEEAGAEGSGTEAEALYRTHLGEGHKMMEHAREVLTLLKDRGYRLYAATNGTAKTQWKRLTDAQLLPFFEEIFISEEMGYEKPDRKFFRHIFDSLQERDKTEFLMVGDSLTSDIQGAHNAGIDSVWYNTKKLSRVSFPVQSTYTITNLLELPDLLETAEEQACVSSSLLD